ncbi:DNA adenine methylase [Campylobacter sp. LR291e]|uniref:DNA adenine methylase n=1 Tax=Campylobacter sp. LR291e TaxID=2593546 RepID=UPI001CC2179A|nr:DNA adenine methylase [Campylobacter sp. LR291e]
MVVPYLKMACKANLESKPFLKWAGGKRNILEFILPFVPKKFNNYFEPFLGGAALFFYLKNQGILESKYVYLNDKNNELMNVYKVIRENPKEFLNELKKFANNHNKEHFYKIRNLDRDKKAFGILSLYLRAARFMYLNKTCFNGLCRYNLRGEFNTPLGSYKNPKIYDESLVLNAHNALKNTFITNDDFEKSTQKAKKGDFIYFDPPYAPLNKTSSFVSYTDNFLENEQIRLFKHFKTLDSKGIKVLQSNSNTAFISKLYKDFKIIEIKAKRAINCKSDKRGEIVELLIKGNYE